MVIALALGLGYIEGHPTVAGAVFCATLACIPMLVALYRGERVRYLRNVRRHANDFRHQPADREFLMAYPYPPPPSAPKPAKVRRWPWILGIIGAFLVGILIGAASAGQNRNQAASPATNAPAAQPPTAPPPAAAPATTAPPPAKPVGPLTQFGDGKYLVGTDIAVGSYKSGGPRPGGIGQCYWARLKDDSGNDIIANDLAQGPTRVTVKAGEYLEVKGCDFTKS